MPPDHAEFIAQAELNNTLDENAKVVHEGDAPVDPDSEAAENPLGATFGPQAAEARALWDEQQTPEAENTEPFLRLVDNHLTQATSGTPSADHSNANSHEKVTFEAQDTIGPSSSRVFQNIETPVDTVGVIPGKEERESRAEQSKFSKAPQETPAQVAQAKTPVQQDAIPDSWTTTKPPLPNTRTAPPKRPSETYSRSTLSPARSLSHSSPDYRSKAHTSKLEINTRVEPQRTSKVQRHSLANQTSQAQATELSSANTTSNFLQTGHAHHHPQAFSRAAPSGVANSIAEPSNLIRTASLPSASEYRAELNLGDKLGGSAIAQLESVQSNTHEHTHKITGAIVEIKEASAAVSRTAGFVQEESNLTSRRSSSGELARIIVHRASQTKEINAEPRRAIAESGRRSPASIQIDSTLRAKIQQFSSANQTGAPPSLTDSVISKATFARSETSFSTCGTTAVVSLLEGSEVPSTGIPRPGTEPISNPSSIGIYKRAEPTKASQFSQNRTRSSRHLLSRLRSLARQQNIALHYILAAYAKSHRERYALEALIFALVAELKEAGREGGSLLELEVIQSLQISRSELSNIYLLRDKLLEQHRKAYSKVKNSNTGFDSTPTPDLRAELTLSLPPSLASTHLASS